MTETAPISLRWRIDPPVSLVSDGAVALGVLFALDRRGLAAHPPRRLNLVVAQVGAPKPTRAVELRQAFVDIRDAARKGDRVTWIAARGALPAERIDDAFGDPVPTLAAALTLGAQAITAIRDPEAATRLVIVVNTAVGEPMQDLLGAASALSEQAIGVELFCAHPAADLGLLTRLANLGGGETRVHEARQSLAVALVERVEELRDQRVLDAQIELAFSPIVQPGQLFRVEPRPVFLRNIRLGDDSRALTIELGPVTLRGPDPTFLLSATLPKRRIGRYRLFDARIYTRESGERALWTGGAVQRCSADPHEAGEVEAEVVAARERVEVTAWAEDVARAYAEGDARRVSSTLDRLVRHFVTLGHAGAVEQIAAMRLRFLRSGSLGRQDVNRLRRLAAAPTAL
ncbi:MAG: hypothetical protein R3F65_11740 [bacterium]